MLRYLGCESRDDLIWEVGEHIFGEDLGLGAVGEQQ